MKFAVCLIFAFLAVYSVSTSTVTTNVWGTVTNRTLGSKSIVVTSSMLQVKETTFTYPQGQSNYTIHGIKQMDYKSYPSTTTFLKGGIGQRNVTIKLTSQRGHGLNSTFIFYTL
ncbi:uncharacterized protein LOC116349744 [Contarinia nasturtii]|uniref:uncharacterized protein LOC116349744 n=1 Tax=Contarinia nasturtii TaxID=265458 RepID=UPI0012D46C1F|nr:uncharacterized protein LOC116349744 [Contarinia nasturtii]